MSSVSRGGPKAFGPALALLAVLTIGILVFGGVLIPTLGIVTVGAGLFLRPRHTAIVALTALALALALLTSQQMDHQAARFGNVALACSLAILASWTIEQRIQGIERLNRTQASIFASVPDGLAVLDTDGAVIQLNDALRAIAPAAAPGQPLHPHLGHVLADGSACPGGCALATAIPTDLVEGESITRLNTQIPVEYAVAAIDGTSRVVSLRDVSSVKAAEENRLMILEAAVRQGEQQQLLKALAPEAPLLPTVSGLQFDAYSAGGVPGEADLVNVTELGDGTVLVMILDALGEGVLSARDAWKVLYVARASIEAGVRVEDVVHRTAQTLSRDADAPDVSLMVAVIDPVTGSLDLVGAGHPPALLIRGSGATEWLESTAAAIGGPGRATTTTAITRQLLPEDSLILYTDGVVDGAENVIEGLSALRSSAAALRKRHTQGWAATVTQAVRVPTQKSGSATLLLVRRDPDSGARQTSATR